MSPLFFTSLYSGAYVIAMCGTQGVGKTTLCRAIKKLIQEKQLPNVDVHVLSFADPLREMAASIFGDDWAFDSKKHGVKDGPALQFSLPMIAPDYSFNKDLKPELHTLTYRETLCLLGPALQKAFGEDLFANAMIDRIDGIHKEAKVRRCKALILIDDLRKKVESEVLLSETNKFPVQIVHLERLNLPNSADYYDCAEAAYSTNIDGFYYSPISDLEFSTSGRAFVEDGFLDVLFERQLDRVA